MASGRSHSPRRQLRRGRSRAIVLAPNDLPPWPVGGTRLPPYNEHLITDIGALTLALVLTLSVAAVTMQPLMVRTALTSSLMFGIPHFVFHAMHLTMFPVSISVTQTAVLSLGIVAPVALLVLCARQTAAR